MKLACVVFVLCILAFASPQDADNKSLRSTMSSLSRSQETHPSHSTVPKSSRKVPTSDLLTHESHWATGHPTTTSRSQKTPSSHTIIPKSSRKVPTSYPTIGTTSQQKPKSPISQKSHPTSTEIPKSSPPAATTTAKLTQTSQTTGTSTLVSASKTLTVSTGRLSPISQKSHPTSTEIPKSSPPAATTTAKSTQTSQTTGTSTLVSASKTLTVSNGQTASAQVGWLVVGVGVGGAVAVGDSIVSVPGGSEGIIIENSSGQDELSTIDSDTSITRTTSSPSTSTSRSTSRSRSTPRSSSSTSSSTASPTPYNIYPKLDSTPTQQSAFAQDLEQIAQPGSVRRITGGRDQLLLWVAFLTPAQASELSRNPVVSPLPSPNI